MKQETEEKLENLARDFVKQADEEDKPSDRVMLATAALDILRFLKDTEG
jgi:hypothetical protein